MDKKNITVETLHALTGFPNDELEFVLKLNKEFHDFVDEILYVVDEIDENNPINKATLQTLLKILKFQYITMITNIAICNLLNKDNDPFLGTTNIL